MFIDLHLHIRSTKRPILHGGVRDSTPEYVLPLFDKFNIDKGVLLPAPGGNEEAIKLHQEYPDRFIPFCNVDPRTGGPDPHAPLDNLLGFYKKQGCKGVGEITANLPFNDPMVENLFFHCQQLELPVLFHIAPTKGGAYGLYDEPGLPLLERALGKFPDLIFIGHSQPFWAEIAPLETPGSRMGYPDSPIKKDGAVPKLMRKYPNLHGDLSAGSGHNAISRSPDFGCKFLEEFQDRLYFGTDGVGIYAGHQDSPPHIDFLNEMREEGKISKECYNKVAHKNAKKLLDL